MNQAFKKKWVAALRSGEFKQGGDYLKREGKYCCLGVARELIEPKSRNSFMNEGAYLHTFHAQAIGLSVLQEDRLANLNDNGVPFEMIAGFIDHYL